jgi:hypothetical protein
MSQEQEKGHVAVPFSSVGLHRVAACNSFAVPYDFVFRSNCPTKGAVIISLTTRMLRFLCCSKLYKEVGTEVLRGVSKEIPFSEW